MPAVELPEVVRYPVIFAPVPVTTKIFALPATDIAILPFAATNKLLLPSATVERFAILDALNVPVTVKLATLAVVKLAILATILPTFALPVAFSVPLILAPVAVNTATFEVPLTEIVTLLPGVEIDTLLLPSLIAVTLIPLALNVPVTVMLLTVVLPVMFALPVTVKLLLP